MRGAMPSRSTTPSTYARISAASEKRRVHPGFSAKEKEYQWEGTSHAAPGYVFHSHVPPTPAPFSNTK